MHLSGRQQVTTAVQRKGRRFGTAPAQLAHPAMPSLGLKTRQVPTRRQGQNMRRGQRQRYDAKTENRHCATYNPKNDRDGLAIETDVTRASTDAPMLRETMGNTNWSLFYDRYQRTARMVGKQRRGVPTGDRSAGRKLLKLGPAVAGRDWRLRVTSIMGQAD